MGWLRDLMQASTPPFRSFGALARQALASSDWPAGTAPQARSLAALFSKFDRRLELEWLADRPDVQRVLARCLGRPLGDVRSVLGPSPSPLSDAATRFRFEDIPYARPLDLLREGLCPGFPPELALPATWGSLWWYAPAGSGELLVSSWLEARGLCHVVRADTVQEALASVPEHGPVWLGVAHVGSDADARALEALRRRGGVCVAAARMPIPPPGFQRLSSLAPEAYLDDVVGWIAQRLPEDGHFDEVAARGWLRQNALTAGVVDSLGTLLGLCGALDEIDHKKLGPGGVEKLAGLYFNAQLSLARLEDAPVGAWLRRQGVQVIVALASRLLVDAEDPWDIPRTFDAWLELVPLEYQRDGDLEWMSVALADPESPLRPADLARAAKRMPPGAYRVVRGLERAGFLRATEDGLLRLAPRWLGESVIREARRQLLRGSPVEWGEAVLNPRETRLLLAELRRQAENQNYGPFEAALELETGREPAGVACIEASFLTLGLLVLAGGEVPQDLLEGLWHEQLAVLVEIDWTLPRQRLLCGDLDAAPRGSEPALPNAAFHLAALAISEQLPQGVGRRHPLLRAWLQATPPLSLTLLYDGIERLLSSTPEVAEFEIAAVALIDRLRNAIGQASASAHALECAGIVLDEVEHEVMSHEALLRVAAVPRGVHQLKGLAERRGIAWDEVSHAFWGAWQDAGQPAETSGLFAPNGEAAAWFWSSIPVAILRAFLSGQSELPYASALPYVHFGMEQWQALLDALETEPLPKGIAEAWRVIPEAVVDSSLERADKLVRAGAFPDFWAQHAACLLAHIQRATRERRAALVVDLIADAPLVHTPAIMACLLELPVLELKPDALDRLRLWLACRSSYRAEGWRAVYTLLDALEEAVLPLRAAR